jgi:SAM-dependent methyltransferase
MQMVSKNPAFRMELFVPGLGPGLAFDLLVSELERSLPADGLRFEPGRSGRFFERRSTGEEQEIAQVTEWVRGERMGLAWQPVERGREAAPVSVEYRFEPEDGGTKITIEYGEWDPSTPLVDGAERASWFADAVVRPMIRATAPRAFGDWWTDRVARRPSGAAARKTYANPIYHRPNFLILMERLQLKPEDRLLEVGCGGGAFLQDALASGCRAVAIDHSPEMVRLAREQNQKAIEEKRAEIVEADAHHLPFPDASCTCAVSTGSFGFWDRPVVALAEIRRVLQPGGRFLLFTGTKELRGTPAAPEPVASRAHWYEDDELASLAREAGFAEVRVDRPNMGKYARQVGVPAEALPLFESGTASGQVLEARRPVN